VICLQGSWVMSTEERDTQQAGDNEMVLDVKAVERGVLEESLFSDVDESRYRVIHNMGSRVLIDEAEGVVFKAYKPGRAIRLMYWLAFQSKFPYESNANALRAAELRREIANSILAYELSPELVARPLAGNPAGLTTQFVKGTAPRDKATAKRFLKFVTRAFLRTGLPTWQVSPWQPKATGNLIEGEDADYRIIDLESNLVSPFVPLSQLGELLDQGLWPAFDDINVKRLRSYTTRHAWGMRSRLGNERAERLYAAIDEYEAEARAWHASERRYLSRSLSFLYKVVTAPARLPRFVRSVINLVRKAENEVEQSLDRAIDNWRAEGRLDEVQATRAQEQAQKPEVKAAIRHLAAHVTMSVPLRFPLGSIARPAWTLAYRARAEWKWLRGRRDEARIERSVHTLAVAFLGAIPGAGAFAYAAAAPLRRNIILVQLLSDELGKKLPFNLHKRLGLRRLVTLGRGVKVAPASAAAVQGPEAGEKLAA
jgi:hypothetical protein